MIHRPLYDAIKAFRPYVTHEETYCRPDFKRRMIRNRRKYLEPKPFEPRMLISPGPGETPAADAIRSIPDDDRAYSLPVVCEDDLRVRWEPVTEGL